MASRNTIAIAIVANGSSAQRAAQATSRAFARMGDSASSVNRTLRRLAATGIVAGGLYKVADAALATYNQLQNASIGFEYLFKSSSDAAEAMAAVKELASTTQFPVDQLADYVKRFAGAGSSMRKAVAQTKKVLDLTSAYGLTADEAGRAVLALSQIQARGTVQLEEVNQMVDAGIPAAKLFAESLGLTNAEFRKMTSEGALPADKALKALFKTIDKDYSGAAVRQAKTLQGQWKTMKTQANLALVNGLTPLFEYISKQMPNITKSLTDFIKKLGPTLGKIPGMIEASKPAFRTMREAIRKIGTTADKAMDQVKDLIAAVAPGFEGVVSVNSDGMLDFDFGKIDPAKIGAGLADWLGRLFGAVDFAELGKQLARVTLPGFSKLIDGLVEGVYAAFKENPVDTTLAILSFVPFGKIVGGVGKLLGKLGPPLAKLFGKIPIPWGKVGDAFFNGFLHALDFIDRWWQKFAHEFSAGGTKWNPSDIIISIGTKLSRALTRLVTAMATKAKEIAGGIVRGLAEGFADRFPKLAFLLRGLFRTLFVGVLGDIFRNLVDGLANILEKLPDFLVPDGLISELRSLGASIPSEYAAGIGTGQSAVFTSAANIPDWVASGYSSVDAAAKAHSAGTKIPAAYAAAMNARAGSAKAAGANLAGNAKKGLDFIGPRASEAGKLGSGAFSRSLSTGGGRANAAGSSLAQQGAAGARSGASGFPAVGGYAADGFAAGISANAYKAEAQARAMAADAAAAAAAGLKARSPSRVFMQLGLWAAEGFTIGMTKGTKAAHTAARKLVDVFAGKPIKPKKPGKSASEKEVKQYKKDLAAYKKAQNEHIANLKKGLTQAVNLEAAARKGGTPLATQLINIAKAAKKANKDKTAAFFTKAAAKYNAVLDKLDKAKDKLKDLIDARSDMRETIRSSVNDTASLLGLDLSPKAGAGQVVKLLTQQVKKAQEFQKNIEMLKKKGLSKDYLKELAEAGPEQAGALIDALKNATPAQIKAINDARAKIAKVANDLSTKVSNDYFKAGIAAATGLVKGLESQKKAIEKSFQRLAKIAIEAFRKELKMHSPSRKFRDDGALLVDSVILGTNSRVRALRSTFANLGTQASQGFSSTAGLDSSLSAAVSSSAAARNGSGNTYVTIQQNVPPNADLAAVGKASVDAIDAYVRKTGRAPAFVQRKR